MQEHKILATRPARFSGSAALAFSPNGKWLASADSDTEIRIIDLDKMAVRATVDEVLMETFAIAFTPDSSMLLAGGADQVLTAIEPATGKVLRRFVGETRLYRMSVSAWAADHWEPFTSTRTIPPDRLRHWFGIFQPVQSEPVSRLPKSILTAAQP